MGGHAGLLCLWNAFVEGLDPVRVLQPPRRPSGGALTFTRAGPHLELRRAAVCSEAHGQMQLSSQIQEQRLSLSNQVQVQDYTTFF